MSLSAHDYYFAFAEVSYNSITEKIEITLSTSAHDIENELQDELHFDNDLESALKNEKLTSEISSYIQQHFKIKTKELIQFDLIGTQVQLNGIVNFYFESVKTTITDEIVVVFDLLMSRFKEQQNKISFNFRGHIYTRPFLQDKRTQIIYLDNN